MELCYKFSSATKAYVSICGIFIIFSHVVIGQDVTCNSVVSDTTNVFDTYDITVSGSTNNILTYDPIEYTPGNNLPVGTTEVSVTAMNSTSTVIGSCTFNVTVDLSELPIACPMTNDIERTDPGESTFRFLITNLQSLPGFNYVPNGPVISVLLTNTTGVDSDRFPVGIHAVSVRYADEYLDKVCNFTLMVVDVEPPTVNCPEDILESTTNAITYTPQSITDNIPEPVLLQNSLIYSPATLSPGSRFPLGVSTITISITDGAGNEGDCSFDVNVAIQELPITCPTTMVFTTGTDPGQAFYTYQPSTFNITYPSESMSYIPYGNITMMRAYDGNPNSSLALSPPAHAVTITISDGTLQKVCNEATVTVEDREPPTIVCPDDIFQDHIVPDQAFIPQSFEDNVGVVGDFAVGPFLENGSFPVGTTTYTFAVSDEAGNSASCSFNVTVVLATTTSTQAPLTPTIEGTTDAVMQSTAGLSSSDSLPIIIGCAVGGGVLLLIIIILAICCSSPGRRARFGIGVKEPGRVVGASRHGVATDPVLLNDRLQRTRSNIYAETTIDDVEMTEDSPDTMADTNGATGGGSNGVHTNDAYDEDDITLAKSVL